MADRPPFSPDTDADDRPFRADLRETDFLLDPRERARIARAVRKAKLMQAVVGFWLLASPLVIVPLLFHWSVPWIAAVVVGMVGAVAGYALPTNIPQPRAMPPGGTAYGVYDPRGPHGPRS